MLRIKQLVLRRLRLVKTILEEPGQTLVEYGMIVALLAIVAVAILATLGHDVVNLFTAVSSHFQDIATP